MQKGTITKYQPSRPIDLSNRQWPDKSIRQAPIWASVDLRDGNQALAIPMNVEEKIEFFELLVAIGFKEIEVGFPSASETEFSFIRRLVDENRIIQFSGCLSSIKTLAIKLETKLPPAIHLLFIKIFTWFFRYNSLFMLFLYGL